ncbi:YbjQ family protein [Alicyclobacillus cycloheptanicus]|uniref:Uncharacterized protein YbjQ (UPF0145 family) n=1 Tax=Alicyclobacillus cycloheptanicus TaxID=1457 RepID=A0ABT9XIN4_9BACL|nr:heavy metal-binding domain-containing protein [Alicyclobacillus cycloheptanicus]MDQ0189571.1 uncharacterized protein YbjQ (UPF0145 family) [Alicyclobacillus cycloheptanicus]WDM01624.1 YbjQ family protein [Alicyclobacillus cycloheptanicus]
MRGDLPPNVVDRLEQERAGGLPWTSDLSVNEWHLMRSVGFRPLGMVMGSCFYHVGYSVASRAGTWYSRDLTDVQAALYEGRHRALHRLAQEAKQLGANAVVGVRIQHHKPGYFGHESEFAAFGTAVSVDGLPPSDAPVLCTVDGQSLVKLMQAGAFPVGLAMGACVHYQYTSRQDKWQMTSWYNQEIPTFTSAVYETRNRAVRDMWKQAREFGASGVLAHETRLEVMKVEVERGQGDEREDHVLEFLSIGTAVASTTTPVPLHPEVVLDVGK